MTVYVYIYISILQISQFFPLQDCIKFTYDLAAELRSKPAGALTPGYNLMKPLKKFLERSLPEDAHIRASGKLYISLTNVKTRKNEIFSEYKNREELIKVSDVHKLKRLNTSELYSILYFLL